jgi:ATP-binding cassette subfamily B protein
MIFKTKNIHLLKRLWPYLIQHKKDLIKGILLVIILTLGGLARPFILRLVIDNAVPSQNLNQVYLYSVAFVGILVSGVFLGYYQIRLMARFGRRVINQIKAELFEHVLDLGLSFFSKHQVGWLISRVESDTEQLKQFCTNITVRIFMDSLMFIGILAVLYASDPQIAGVITGILVFLFLLIFTFLGRMRSLYDAVRAKYAELTGFVSEYIQGISVIQLYNRQNEVRNHLKVVANERYQTELKSSFYEYGFWAVFVFFTETLLIAAVLYFGIAKVFSGEMTIGKLVMFIEFSRQMTWPLHTFSENFNVIQRAMVSTERVFDILDTEPEVQGGVTPEAASEFSADTIEFKDVSFAYKEGEWALKDVNLTIQKGERIALVGPSGGGKTTLTKLLCRFHDPQEGKVLINGKELTDIEQGFWRTEIGLVLQDVYLFPGTVLDNLRALDTDIPEEQVYDAAKKLGAHQFIEKFSQGYQTELSERGSNLSLGERQLLSFTRALTFDPEILILDEATASIDPYTEALLQKALERLLEGRTSVIVAHRLSTIRNVDRIVVIENGEIVEVGNHTDLMKLEGVYHRLYQLQQETRKMA